MPTLEYLAEIQILKSENDKLKAALRTAEEWFERFKGSHPNVASLALSEVRKALSESTDSRTGTKGSLGEE